METRKHGSKEMSITVGPMLKKEAKGSNLVNNISVNVYMDKDTHKLSTILEDSQNYSNRYTIISH